MLQFFKMCRISCDSCEKRSFEVFTFEKSVDPPEGWMNVTSYGWGSGYSRTHLCCPDCVENAKRDPSNNKIEKSWGISLNLKNDGSTASGD